MRPLALATIGLPCGSFVFINSATSKRTAEEPFGDESLGHARLGNVQHGMHYTHAYMSTMDHGSC